MCLCGTGCGTTSLEGPELAWLGTVSQLPTAEKLAESLAGEATGKRPEGH